MMNSDWSDLKEWDEALVSDDEDGKIPIRFGLGATLYFHNGHTEEKRRAALACFNDYERLCGALLQWYCVEANSRRMYSVAKLRSFDMSPYLLSSKWNAEEAREQAWSFYWHGGKHRDDASPLKIHAYGSPKMYAELDNSLSFLQVSVPVMWFQNNAEDFLGLMLSWCERLKPHHGYGGILVLDSPDRGLAQYYAPTIAALAAKHPGLEIDRPMSHKMVTQFGIKGGNWFTILSTAFVEKLGGADALGKALGEPFGVHRFDAGIIIVAGPKPEIGDRNRNIHTPNYKKLAEVLKPIRIHDHPKPYSKGRFAEDGEFESWLARFDE